MMTADQIRDFIEEATSVTGDWVSVTERIVERWLQDREAAQEEARDAIYDDAMDSWNGG